MNRDMLSRRLKREDYSVASAVDGQQGDEQKAKEVGCKDHDTKPVELPRLLEKMEKLLRN